MTTVWTREPALTRLDLPGLTPAHRGKVREMFDLGDRMLMVATDRISAFDCILPTGIPGKGKILTALSVAWFQALDRVVSHHYISNDINGFPDAFKEHSEALGGRSLLVRKADRFDVECVVRGYLAGSGWKEYRQDGTVCGITLPRGLRLSDQLPEPIFTPATKEDDGHDENIPFSRMADIVGGKEAETLRTLSLSIYTNLAAYCATRGIIVADTKFEFGMVDGTVSLIDEVLTPDSSRFWPADTYEPGKGQESFDKQFIRDYLETLDWDKTPPAPGLPEAVTLASARRYAEAYERLVDPHKPLRFSPETWK
jgi:phosphoribosylaminoimidazole-succinocarboxamide synthase